MGLTLLDPVVAQNIPPKKPEAQKDKKAPRKAKPRHFVTNQIPRMLASGFIS